MNNDVEAETVQKRTFAHEELIAALRLAGERVASLAPAYRLLSVNPHRELIITLAESTGKALAWLAQEVEAYHAER
jgi:hypothetical protein